jgi:hypothetical protein
MQRAAEEDSSTTQKWVRQAPEQPFRKDAGNKKAP